MDERKDNRMTTFAINTYTCSVCKAENRFVKIKSFTSFGYPDLDLLPPKMDRSKTPFSVQECRRCGYVNRTVEVPLPASVNSDWLQSDAYQSCEGIHLESSLAKRYYRQYMVCREGHQIKEAFDAVLKTAWMCDDDHNKRGAVLCRLIAADMIEELLDTDPDPYYGILWADLMRRAEQYDRVLEESENKHYPRGQEMLEALLMFERKKAKERDNRGYSISDALDSEGFMSYEKRIVTIWLN